ncbi:heat-shock protein Hsp70, partial [Halotia wernerae UHCC 0503]|nr:heat-shock protein Hsp70 [Halotia wernerae UHCC 0503]
LTVTTTEKGKGQQGTLVVNNAGIQKLSSHELKQARADLEALFESDETIEISSENISDAVEIAPELAALLDRAQQALLTVDSQQAEELQDLLGQIENAVANNSAELPQLQEELEDFLYYASTNESE